MPFAGKRGKWNEGFARGAPSGEHAAAGGAFSFVKAGALAAAALTALILKVHPAIVLVAAMAMGAALLR